MSKNQHDIEPEQSDASGATIAGKGRPTPTRREREAANKRPLVPDDRKEANRLARQQAAEARERARIGLANGEERYLPVRDRGPQKRWVRDLVDSRFNLGELIIPAMFAAILLMMIPNPSIAVISLAVLWGFVAIAVIDAIVLGRRILRGLGEQFGETRVERGVRWYGAMRAMQMRFLRLPKPLVKRGGKPVR